MHKTKGRPTMRQGREWFRIRNLNATTTELYIYDEIGYWGTTASDLVATLSELQGVTAIDVHINSPGGDVFDGLAIMNCLRACAATVTTYVDGIAASIASVIAMAGERVVMGPHSQLMIHDASGLCLGNATDMREMADMLDFQSDNIAAVYAEKAGGSVADWRAHMTAETWYTAEEAVAAGLADEVAQRSAATAGVPMDKAWDLSVFAYAGREAAPAPVIDSAEQPEAEPAAVEPAPEPGEDEQPDDTTTETASESLGTGQPEAPAAGTEAPPVATAPAAPEPEQAPSGEPEPTNTWAAAVAHLTTPAASTEDLLAALREA